jgi:hypothetical protein
MQRINLRETARNGGIYAFTADPATDVITVYQGLPSQPSGTAVCIYTESATPPAGLAITVLYYLINIGQARQYKLANSIINAEAGTAIDITSTGTGKHALSLDVSSKQPYKKIELVVRDVAKQISDGTLTLAAINALDATPAITQAQLDKWVNSAMDDYASAGLAARMETDVEALWTREIYVQDAEVETAVKACIKAHSRYV